MAARTTKIESRIISFFLKLMRRNELIIKRMPFIALVPTSCSVFWVDENLILDDLLAMRIAVKAEARVSLIQSHAFFTATRYFSCPFICGFKNTIIMQFYGKCIQKFDRLAGPLSDIIVLLQAN